MVKVEKNNIYYKKYCDVLGFDLTDDMSLEDILHKHSMKSIKDNLFLNYLIHSCLSSYEDRLKVEENSYTLIYNNHIDLNEEESQYLNFKKFCSDFSRENYRNVQLNRSEEVQNKMANSNRGKKRTVETKQKMSNAKKGKEPWNKGIPCREETKIKLKKANLGKIQSTETKEKRKNSIHKLKWWNNGKIQVRAEVCPEGFSAGRLPNQLNKEARSKCSQKGKKWFNNGVVNTMATECPEGFVEGRLKSK